jgi:putative ABC transport system permease protein
VAVLGAGVPEVFFGDADPLGRTLHLDGLPFEVIGVLARKGPQIVVNNALHDDMVFVPLGAGARLFGLGDEIGWLIADPHRLDEGTSLHRELRAALWPAHHLAPGDEQAVRFEAIRDFIDPLKKIGVALEVMLGFIGTLILAMAGVGVANLMVAIVSQRRVEIAMRRACGARRSDVILQLLAETLVVVLAGGALGVAFAAAVVAGFSALPLPEVVPPPRVLPGALATTFFVLLAVGLASGWLPARNAARVDPAAALRVH